LRVFSRLTHAPEDRALIARPVLWRILGMRLMSAEFDAAIVP
jgi:hypothetical protein